MLLVDVFFPSLGRNWTKQQQPGKLMLLKGVIPCVNSLRSISGVFKLIHLSVSFSSNYTSVKCHLSRLSLTRVMSSSQPLRQPKWSLHCFEPAGSRCGMEEWAGSPQCDWEAKLTVSFREEVKGGGGWDLSRPLFLLRLIFLRARMASRGFLVCYTEPWDSSGLV